jgi:16S rRNA (uracil1498-N3)-methyltransferase
MCLFYKPGISGSTIQLNESESRHCIRVLRLREGSRVSLVDGVGGWFEAVITDADPKKCRLSIIRQQHHVGKRKFHLHIAIAPTKNNSRLEWFLEKATEIGMDEITPLLTFHTERRKINNERLEKIVVAAMKQSRRAYLPALNPPASFQTVVFQYFDGQKFIATCLRESKKHLKEAVKKDRNVLLLIGPEGDFTEEEIGAAVSNGFEEVSLGPSRLRTETAGIIACHTVNLINE